MISGPEIARIITEFKADTTIITDEKLDPTKDHEEKEGVQISFNCQECQSISMCNERDRKSILRPKF